MTQGYCNLIRIFLNFFYIINYVVIYLEGHFILEDNNPQQKQIKEFWERSLSILRAEIGEATFKSWFKNIEFGEFNNDQLHLYVPTRFMRDWIESHYSERILSLLNRETKEIKSVVIEVVVTKIGDNKDNNNLNNSPKISSKISSKQLMDHNSSVGAPVDEKLSFDNFVVGPSNELAYAAAKRITESI